MLAAVVVAFNPTTAILENIKSYIDCVDVVYVIDNSDISNESIFTSFLKENRFRYIPNLDNLGIAEALNIGCHQAILDNNEWVLTMDQDSKFLNLDRSIVAFLIENKNKKDAIYYPQYEIDGLIYDRYLKKDNQPIYVMTSGNIVDLEIYLKVGGFDNKLFIDYVDIDYCLKLRSFGYNILNLPEIFLKHELGLARHVSFLFFKGIVTNHSSIRRYYITRNRLSIMKKYKTFCPEFYHSELKVFFNDILKIILFENDKMAKFKTILQGYLDFRKNRFGRLDRLTGS